MVFDPGKEWGEGRRKGKGTVTSAGPEADSERGGNMGSSGGGWGIINQTWYPSPF